MQPISYNVILSNGKCTFYPDPAQKELADSGVDTQTEVSLDAALAPETLLTSRRCLSCQEIKLTFAESKEAPSQLTFCKHAICHDCKRDSSAINRHFQNIHPDDEVSDAIERIDDETYKKLGMLTATCGTEGCTTSLPLSTMEQHIDESHKQAPAEKATMQSQTEAEAISSDRAAEAPTTALEETDVEQTAASSAQSEQQQGEAVDPITDDMNNPEHFLGKFCENITAKMRMKIHLIVEGDASYVSKADSEKLMRDVLKNMLDDLPPEKSLLPPPPPPPPPLPTQFGLKLIGAQLPTASKKNKNEAKLETDQALEKKQQMQEELTKQIAIRGQFSDPDSPLSQMANDIFKAHSEQYDESTIKRAITDLLKKHPSYKNINVTQQRMHYPNSFHLSVLSKAEEIIKVARDKATAQQAAGSDVTPQSGLLTFQKAAAKSKVHHEHAGLKKKIKANIKKQFSDPESTKSINLKDLTRQFRNFTGQQVQDVYAGTLLEYNLLLAAAKGNKKRVAYYDALTEAHKLLASGKIETISTEAGDTTTESAVTASESGEAATTEGATGGQTSTQEEKRLEERKQHVRKELLDPFSEVHKFAEFVIIEKLKREGISASPSSIRTAIENELLEKYDTYFGNDGNTGTWNYKDFDDRIRARLGLTTTEEKSPSSTTTSQSDDTKPAGD